MFNIKSMKNVLCVFFLFTLNLFSMYDLSYLENNSVNRHVHIDRVNNKDNIDVKDIIFEDYSISLKTIDFPMFSTYLGIQKKFPILSLFDEIYNFMGYNNRVRTYVNYFSFFRTLKTIEYFPYGRKRDISIALTYSSSMNVYCNNMVKNLSASIPIHYIHSHFSMDINYYY